MINYTQIRVYRKSENKLMSTHTMMVQMKRCSPSLKEFSYIKHGLLNVMILLNYDERNNL